MDIVVALWVWNNIKWIFIRCRNKSSESRKTKKNDQGIRIVKNPINFFVIDKIVSNARNDCARTGNTKYSLIELDSGAQLTIKPSLLVDRRILFGDGKAHRPATVGSKSSHELCTGDS